MSRTVLMLGLVLLLLSLYSSGALGRMWAVFSTGVTGVTGASPIQPTGLLPGQFPTNNQANQAHIPVKA